MRANRRFSQAISEGDGISLLADVGDPEAARAAEAEGAEGIVVRGELAGVRAATDLPMLWCTPGDTRADVAQRAGADAFLLSLHGRENEDGELELRHAEVVESGLDCVVEVRDEDELRFALDRIDPEIFLLSARGVEERDRLEHVLGLLPDVPAGKLVVADVRLAAGTEVAELERAGVDAVIVEAGDVAVLAATAPPEV